MTSRKTRAVRTRKRSPHDNQFCGAALRLELLERRNCFSVDLAIDPTETNLRQEDLASDLVNYDPVVTWFFANASSDFQRSNLVPIVADSVPAVNSYQLVDDALVDCDLDAMLPESSIQSLHRFASPFVVGQSRAIEMQSLAPTAEPNDLAQGLAFIELCDDPLLPQARPLMTTASGQFVSLKFSASTNNWSAVNSVSDLKEEFAVGLVTDARSTTVLEDQRAILSSESLTSESTNQQADTRSSRLEASQSQPSRPNVPAVRQLNVGEGEASAAVEAAARRTRPSTSLDDRVSRTPSFESNDGQTRDHASGGNKLTADILVAAWSVPDFKSSATPSALKAVARANALTQMEQRDTCTGLTECEVNPVPRCGDESFASRPQLAPIPMLDSPREEYGIVFRSLNADRQGDQWRKSPPLASYPLRKPLVASDTSVFELVLSSDASRPDAPLLDEEQSAVSAVASEATRAADHRWYLAALPALLFIPRQVRDRLWQVTMPVRPKRSRSAKATRSEW